MARNGIPNPFNPMDPDWKGKTPGAAPKRKPTGKKQMSQKILKTGSRKPKR
jgi:hypothetical protein